jgi:hypothetical protein
MFQVWTLAASAIEDMFDLTVGMGILGSNPDKLADAAYDQGFQEALGTIKGFLELREQAPEEAAAVLGKKAA